MTPYVDPHTLATGEHIVDYRVTLELVVERSAGEPDERWTIPLTDALPYDNAYDHYVSSYGPLDGSEAVYYRRAID